MTPLPRPPPPEPDNSPIEVHLIVRYPETVITPLQMLRTEQFGPRFDDWCQVHGKEFSDLHFMYQSNPNIKIYKETTPAELGMEDILGKADVHVLDSVLPALVGHPEWTELEARMKAGLPLIPDGYQDNSGMRDLLKPKKSGKDSLFVPEEGDEESITEEESVAREGHPMLPEDAPEESLFIPDSTAASQEDSQNGEDRPIGWFASPTP